MKNKVKDWIARVEESQAGSKVCEGCAVHKGPRLPGAHFYWKIEQKDKAIVNRKTHI